MSPDTVSPAHFFSDDHPELLAPFGLHSLGGLAERECLFLLGRPGAGKSSEIKRLASGEVPGFENEYAIVLRCKESGPDIQNDIERLPAWRKRRDQEKPIRLILDDLDEAYLREGNFFPRLQHALENIRSENPDLRLLLACRPAEWEPGFAKSLHTIWGESGQPAEFVLAPLSRNAQRAILESRDVHDIDGFFQWIHVNHFAEFALWPRPLEWLADQFQIGGAEKINYTDLCCLRVYRGFGEEDKRTQEAGRAERVQVWIHAVMIVAATQVFCGRKGISLDDAEPGCVSLDELFQSVDLLRMPGKPALAREDLREAVRASHLMERHGAYHSFQNQSDLEYLAAAMLGSLEAEQLRELFGCPDDQGCWRVFPQLATTAANLAGQAPRFFDLLRANDPRVLMRVDFTSKPAETRKNAVEAILRATAETGAPGDHEEHEHFATLRQPEIETQLRPWIFDARKPLGARYLAFDIALASCRAPLWEEFRKPEINEDAFLQSRLPLVVMRFGKDWPVETLQELAAGSDDELTGAALSALLDKGWHPRDVAPLLRQPVGNVVGAYQIFLHRLIDRIEADDVAPLIAEIRAQPALASSGLYARKLLETLFFKAIPELDRADVRSALTGYIVSRLEQHDWLLHDTSPARLARLGLDTPETRRSLLLALADEWTSDTDAELLPFNFPLLPEDYGWLLDAVANARDTPKRVLIKLARGIIWQLRAEHHAALERAYSASAEFRAELPATDESGIYATLKRLREEANEKHRKRMAKIDANRNRRPYNHEEHLGQALAACREGRLKAWTGVCRALSQPKSEYDDSEFLRGTHIRQLAGWESASADFRDELTLIAREFLLGVEIPEPAPRQIPAEFFGLVYALSLHTDHLNDDAELRAAIRPMWVRAILRHCGSNDDSLAEPLAALTRIAPSVVAEGCECELRDCWDRNDSIIDPLLAAAWCDETEGALVRVLESSPLKPESYISGLRILLEQNPDAAKQLAIRRLEHQVLQSDGPERRAAIATCLFVIDDLWKRAWPHFVADRESAERLMLEYSRWLDRPGQQESLSRAPAEYIAKLYEFLLEVFPPSRAPRLEGQGPSNPRWDVYQFQNALQRILESRGEHRKLRSIYEHSEESLRSFWIAHSIDRAETSALALRRQPPEPAEFLQFLATEGGTFVSDNASLQRAVVASLRRFEKSLHPDGIVALWVGKGEKPQYEEALKVAICSHLKREFEERKLVINMETQVRPGEHSDIRVEAAPDESHERCGVTLEVKLGHSNDKLRPLLKAMKTQLRDTYLANQNETHGIYVVGWFFCSKFRKGGLRDLKSIDGARRYFGAQAKRLSTGDFRLEAFVLDCRWRESLAAGASKTKRPDPRSRKR